MHDRGQRFETRWFCDGHRDDRWSDDAVKISLTVEYFNERD